MTERKLTLDKRLNLIIGNLRSIANNQEFVDEMGPDRLSSFVECGKHLVSLRASLK